MPPAAQPVHDASPDALVVVGIDGGTDLSPLRTRAMGLGNCAAKGGFYVRGKTANHDETWGALDYDWSGWRNPRFKSTLGNVVHATQGP
ncbi:Uncharacterized protein TCAP_02839 [Tolypocladium capitatum]|uniref:Uncharacterized protein n=1 Tax=Tolypocladium capitatum TaxID=45235 RepID=A0A2K3QI86_9HYPO|nr:Uncharacterized protein TCAP_02839 [Tolypocladium capitatum]